MKRERWTKPASMQTLPLSRKKSLWNTWNSPRDSLTHSCSKKRKRDDGDIDFSGSPPDDNGRGRKTTASVVRAKLWFMVEKHRSFSTDSASYSPQRHGKSQSEQILPCETDFGDDHLVSRPTKNSFFEPKDLRRCQYKIIFATKKETSFRPHLRATPGGQPHKGCHIYRDTNRKELWMFEIGYSH